MKSKITESKNKSKKSSSIFYSPKRYREKSTFFSSGVIQPKLKIGQPGDKYEQEADRVADAVMHMPESQVQRQPISDDEEKLQKKAEVKTSRSGEYAAPSKLTNEIKSQTGSGSLLPKNIQSEMGQKIGADFSGVKIHTDSKSIQMNQELGAKAFTHGSDIFFNEGQYNPGSGGGKHLLAHELTHVVQQGRSKKMINRQEKDGTYQQTGNIVTFDPGKPGGETFTAHTAFQARKLAVEAGFVEPLKSQKKKIKKDKTRDTSKRVKEINSSVGIFKDGKVHLVQPEVAEKTEAFWTQRILEEAKAVRATSDHHIRYLKNKGDSYGAALSHKAAEIFGGNFSGSPDPKIWSKPLKYLNKSLEAIKLHDPMDLDSAKRNYKYAQKAYEEARKEFWEFETSTMEKGASNVVSTLAFTRDASFAIVTTAATVYLTPAGATAVQQGLVLAATSGTSGLVKETATQSGEALSGLDEFDFDIIFENALTQSIAGFVGGTVGAKFIQFISAPIATRLGMYGIETTGEAVKAALAGPAKRILRDVLANLYQKRGDLTKEQMLRIIVIEVARSIVQHKVKVKLGG